MTKNKFSEELERKIVNPNPTEVKAFLDRHRLSTFFKVYL